MKTKIRAARAAVRRHPTLFFAAGAFVLAVGPADVWWRSVAAIVRPSDVWW